MSNAVQGPSGGALVTAAAAMALVIAEGRSQEQLELLSLFLTSLADNLALYAVQLPSGDGESEALLTQ
ncbi:MAG: hypothetical protein LUC87_02770 [Clostridiales bacterium]|nr:hypothetical protein [Clostridiales bacterium]MCD8367344.1 hypothetical protein [Clostridiales bacterium]